MAKVLVSTFTNMPGGILDSFRQAFVDALVREGNDVLLFKTNDFLENYNKSNQLARGIDSQKLVQAICDFAPDAVVSMNHSGLFKELLDRLDCPIGVWLLDGPAYLLDPDECRRQRTRYQMLTPVRAFREDLIDGFGFADQHVHYLPFASDFQASSVSGDNNIAFVGTFFPGAKLGEIVCQNIHNRETIENIRRLVDSYKEDRDCLFAKRLQQFNLTHLFSEEFAEAYILNTIAMNHRIGVLGSVSDLGLSIYGTQEWPSVMPFSIGLALSFHPASIVTQAHLEAIYNQTKINLNVSHTQARGGLPWRVFDIMACNGALVSDFQEDLSLLFEKEIKIPTYASPAEARELCLSLLKDEPKRKAIVEGAQRAIEAGHRLKHRIQSLSQSLGIDLTPGKQGTYTFLKARHFKTGDADSWAASLTRNSSGKQISVQVFQSSGLVFDPKDSQLAVVVPNSEGRIEHTFRLPRAASFLRLDIGEYFSKHRNVSVRLANASQNAELGKEKTIDLGRELLVTNQFHFDGQRLLCGYDSYCVFQNPFPGGETELTFASTLEGSLSD